MATSRLEGEQQALYNDHIQKIIQPVFPQFDQIVKAHARFHLLFLGAVVVEVVLLLIFFTFLAKSSLLAFGLALLFLTSFGYLSFRSYMLTAKPDRLLQIKNQFIESFKTMTNYQEGIPEHHMALANACCRLSENLSGKELGYYRPPAWLEIISPSMEMFSFWWHWHDVHHMRELLLLASLEEHLKLVRCEPTSLEIHAALANAYVLLSGLYMTPCKRLTESQGFWSTDDKVVKMLEQKFRAAAERAIEEFKILSDYAPNDPWVHLQLAYSYQDLKMPQEEIKEYETILKINPDDKEVLFKLGSLYFQQGMNAKGLKVYEELKLSHFKKAETLIKLYGISTFL